MEGLLIYISGSHFWTVIGTSSGDAHVLFMWQLGFLITVWVGPKTKHPKRKLKLQVIKVYAQKLALWSKWHLFPISRKRRPNTCAHCILVSELPRKIQHSQALTQRRNRACFRSGHLHPVASGPYLAANAGQLTCTCSFCVAAEGPCPLPTGDRYGSGVGQVLYDTMKQSKYMLSLKQGKIFPHKVMSPAQAVRTPYPLVKKCSRPKAHSFVAEWGLK